MPTFSIRIVDDRVALSCQVTEKLTPGKALEFIAIPVFILYIVLGRYSLQFNDILIYEI